MLDIVFERYGHRIPGILKDDKGVPTGYISGAAGTVIDREVMPGISSQVLAPFLKRELEEWGAMGVTTLSTRLQGNEITAYGLLDRADELPLRVGYSHAAGLGNPYLERALKRFGNLQGHGTEWLWMIGLSVGRPFSHIGREASWSRGGICSSLTKQLKVEGDIHFPDGFCEWQPLGEPGAETIIVAHRYGYRLTGMHTFGDKGYLMMLDAFEQANREDSILGRGFGLDHGMMVSPEIVEKSAKLDVIWSLQPPMFYTTYAAAVSRVYGQENAHRWMFPVKSLIDAGVRVTYGADTHDDPQRQPLFNLEVLVTRRVKDGRIFGPREAIDRATALLMMTRWGADYVLRSEELGSLEAGKLADLVILDKNPLDRNVPDEDLSEITVVATLIGGKVIYGSLNPEQ
jgi:predicted amidohydrolase YtcJ